MWWRRLGFIRSPYFGDELDVSDLSDKLFVGRQKEAKSLLIDVSEDNRALVCVGGISGSGKTSFINHCQHVIQTQECKRDIDLPKVMPCITKVQLHDNENYNLILLKILSSLIASLFTHCSLAKVPKPSAVVKMKDAIDSTVSSGGGWGGGATAFGFGVNLNRDKAPIFNESPLNREGSLISMIKDVVQIAVNELKLDGVGVVINNVETLSQEYFLEILNYGRDSIFNLENVWWYLSGPVNLGRIVESKAPRLRGFVSGLGIDLSPLKVQQVLELLELRRREYALGDDVQLPVGKRVVELLYGASSGDLRFLFNMCGNIVRLVVKEMPSLEVNEEISIQAIAVLTRRNLSHCLETQLEGKIVRECLVQKYDHIVADDYRKFGYDDAASFSEGLLSLTQQQLLWMDSDQLGGATFSPRGYLQLGILSDLGKVI